MVFIGFFYIVRMPIVMLKIAIRKTTIREKADTTMPEPVKRANIVPIWKRCWSKISGFFSRLDDAFFAFIHKHDVLILLIIISGLALVPRLLTMNLYSGDYDPFLKPWYDFYLQYGYNATGYAKAAANYPPAYTTFIGFLTLFRLDSTVGNPNIVPTYLYAIKIYDFLHEYVAAFFMLLIVKKLSKNRYLPVFAYSGILFLPTLFANSAMWDQCDIIYATFLLGSLYFFIVKKPGWAMLFFGLAFANKLQAIFFLPFILVLFLRRDMRFRYFFYIPLVYLASMIPSLICGIPFSSLALIYINQTGQYGCLNMSIANITSFLANISTGIGSGNNGEAAFYFLIIAAIALCGVLAFVLYKNKRLVWDARLMIKISYLFALLVPYLLPSMHDRYYFWADVLAIAYIFVVPRKCYIAISTIFVSSLGYIHWLFGKNLMSPLPINESSYNNLDNRLGAIIMLAMIIVLAIDIFSDKKKAEEITAPAQ